MRKQLTALCLSALILSSCNNDDLDTTLFTKTGLPMEGSQEVPAKPGAGNGTIDATYNQTTRTLSYTVKWNSLSGAITGFHIHGLAGKGFNSGIVQNFSGYPTTQTGSFSGTFFVDGVAVKEENLLNGLYYINIHTALNPGGEIRGQLILK